MISVICICMVLIGLVKLALPCGITINRKINNVYSLLAIAMLIIIMGGSISNPDTAVYTRIYSSTTFFTKDIGFGFLVLLGHKIGLSQNAFILLVATIGFLLINHTVRKYVEDTSIIWGFYILFPYFMDVVQLRNFLACAFLVFSFSFLCDNTKKGKMLFIVFVLLGASMQKTAIAYIPLVFIEYVRRKKITRYLLGFSILLGMILGTNPGYLQSIIAIVSQFADNLDGIESFLKINTHLGGYLRLFFVLLTVALSYLAMNGMKKEPTEQGRKMRFAELVYLANCYMLFFFPFYMIDVNYYRIPRNLTILTLVSCVMDIQNNMKVNKRNGRKRNVINASDLGLRILLMCTVLFLFYMQFLWGTGDYFESIVKEILSHNWIFGN